MGQHERKRVIVRRADVQEMDAERLWPAAFDPDPVVPNPLSAALQRRESYFDAQ